MKNYFLMTAFLFFSPAGFGQSEIDGEWAGLFYRFREILLGEYIGNSQLILNSDCSYSFGGWTFDMRNVLQEDGESGDWGKCLFCLDSDGNMIFRGRGAEEAFIYEPHFFISLDGAELFILCQLAFEYCYGADVFVVSGKEMGQVGMISVEPAREEEFRITAYTVIERVGDAAEFSFPVERLVFDPGDRCIEMENRGYKYIYLNGVLSWTGPDPDLFPE